MQKKSRSLTFALLLTMSVAVAASAADADSTSSPLTSEASPADTEVARIGGRSFTARQITAEFSFMPPALVQHAKRSDNAARLVALGWYTEVLASKEAEAGNLLRDKPGLEAAAEAAKRKVIATYAIDAHVNSEYKPEDQELRQLVAMNDAICNEPPRYRIAEIGILSGRRATPEEAAAAAKRLDQIRRRLEQGEPFDRVAAESSDLETKQPGGEVGWLTQEELVALPNGADVEKLAAGERTDAIKLPTGGFVIVKMLERADARRLSLEECRPRLEKLLNREFRERVSRQWFDELAARYNASMNIDAFVAAVRAVELAPDWMNKEAAKLDLEN